jgi:hypothetical protein
MGRRSADLLEFFKYHQHDRVATALKGKAVLFHFVQLLWRSFGETNLSVFFSVKISKKIWRINLNFTIASLARGWIQEIKRMWPVLLAHGLFLT